MAEYFYFLNDFLGVVGRQDAGATGKYDVRHGRVRIKISSAQRWLDRHRRPRVTAGLAFQLWKCGVIGVMRGNGSGIGGCYSSGA
jgi:hypothetical protein